MENLTLYQFAEKLQLLGYAKRTIDESVRMMGMFFNYLKEKENLTSLAQLTADHVKSFQTYMTFEKFPWAGDRKGKHHLARSTLAYRFITLKTFFRVMHRENILPYDYSNIVVIPKKRRPLPKNIPSPEQMREIIQAAVPDNPLGIRDRFMLELMYATGIRNSEVRSAQLGDLNVQERTLFVRGKGGKERLVPVGDWIMPYALEHIHTARPWLARLTKTTLLFPTRNGWQIDASMLHKIVNCYRRKAGLTLKISPHLFRHACATHMIQQGADIRYVQELLGHEDLGSTQIYTRVTIGDLKKAHAKYHPANRDDF